MGLSEEPIRRLYVDANIFIYLFESQDERAEKLRSLFLVEREGPIRFLTTSELTLAEVLVGAYRKADEGLIEIYSNWTISNSYLEVGPVQRDVLWVAAMLRATYSSLKLPDAIHLATAFAFNCSHFLTADKDLRDDYMFVDPRGLNRSKALSVLRPEPSVLEGLIGHAA